MFKVYDCKLRLGGSVVNEVPKSGITAPEIEVYRALHGSDAICDIRPSKDEDAIAAASKRTDKQERARLLALFADPTATTPVGAEKKRKMLVELFGHERLPLPKDLEAEALVASGDEEDDDPARADEPVVETAPVPVRRKVGKPAPAFAE